LSHDTTSNGLPHNTISPNPAKRLAFRMPSAVYALLRAASNFSASAANRRAVFSIGLRKLGFSIFFARSPSWCAIARQAVAAVASSASVSSRGMRPILALRYRHVHAVRGSVPDCMREPCEIIQMLAHSRPDLYDLSVV